MLHTVNGFIKQVLETGLGGKILDMLSAPQPKATASQVSALLECLRPAALSLLLLALHCLSSFHARDHMHRSHLPVLCGNRK